MIGKIGLLFLLILSHGAVAAEEYRVTRAVAGKFEDVRDNVAAAITNQGLVINNVSHIGEMLERTGKDMGDSGRIFLKAEILEFCSARVSRESMKADPHAIVFCPYGVSVYVLPNDPGKVYLSYRKPLAGNTPQEKKALRSLEKLMHDIVHEATQ